MKHGRHSTSSWRRQHPGAEALPLLAPAHPELPRCLPRAPLTTSSLLAVFPACPPVPGMPVSLPVCALMAVLLWAEAAGAVKPPRNEDKVLWEAGSEW